MAYCIYTDRDVPHAEGNWDHVVPLSLGGSDEFVVWSDRTTNSQLGSQVDGKLGQDPILAFALRDAGVVGHRGRPTVPVWKRVDIEGRPSQVTWGVEKVTAWDARDRRELSEAELSGKAMSAELRLDLHLTTRFLSKVALGAGAFIYGEAFRAATDCDVLRELALSDLETARNSATLRTAGQRVKVCDRFHEDSHKGRPGYIYRVLMEAMNRSQVIIVPHADAISFHVGLVGMFIGTLICYARTEDLPIDGDHDLGHALVLGPGNFERSSFRGLMEEFSREVLGCEPPQPNQGDGET